MGRRESEVDPHAGPLQRFAVDLRALRREAGSPTYREMARKAGFSDTTLSAAARGRRVPSIDVLRAYVAVCGGDVAAWERRWAELADPQTRLARPERREPDPEPLPVRRPWWRSARLVAAGGVLALAVGLGADAVRDQSQPAAGRSTGRPRRLVRRRWGPRPTAPDPPATRSRTAPTPSAAAARRTPSPWTTAT